MHNVVVIFSPDRNDIKGTLHKKGVEGEYPRK